MASAAAAAAALVVVITTFTPCLNFVTGSTNGGGSPTQQCCGSDTDNSVLHFDTASQIPPPAPSPPETSVQPNSAVDPTAMSPSPPIIQGQRPLLLPSSAWRRAHVSMASVSVVLLIAASVLA
uniref:Bifunctional inhibitor/plant lipid transfer protein/seed storage helical domain-containing protein n=1 Tax=Oryza barthii TaxID=65489 RepID=A0A0D3FQ32_9ORYZ